MRKRNYMKKAAGMLLVVTMLLEPGNRFAADEIKPDMAVRNATEELQKDDILAEELQTEGLTEVREASGGKEEYATEELPDEILMDEFPEETQLTGEDLSGLAEGITEAQTQAGAVASTDPAAEVLEKWTEQPETEDNLIAETENLIEETAQEKAQEKIQEKAASLAEIQQAYQSVGSQMAALAVAYPPSVGSINGEWQILGLVRSGQKVEASVYSRYKAAVAAVLTEKGGVLHAKKYTEYSRVILALTALGEDVTNVAGYNLLEPLSDYDQTVWQGVNGAVFALIAFDCHNYKIPQAENGKTQNSREKLIACILGQELAGGGWALSGGSADVDMTAMALQALAPYGTGKADVKAAIDRGLSKLSTLQNTDGSYSSYGSANSESCSQVIVALTALGIDPAADPRFQKNGKSVLDGLLQFCTGNGSFAHVKNGDADQMASEQGYYALTAYERFKAGKTSLYDMSDVAIKSDQDSAAEVEALISQLPASPTLKQQDIVNAALAGYNALNSTQKALISAASLDKLQKACTTIAALAVAEVEKQIAAIGNVTLAKEQRIIEANAAYHALTTEQKRMVSNYALLQAAQKKLSELKKHNSEIETSDTKNTETIKQTETGKTPGGTTHSVNLTAGTQSGTGSMGGNASGTTGSKTGSRTEMAAAESGQKRPEEIGAADDNGSETETITDNSSKVSMDSRKVLQSIRSLLARSWNGKTLMETTEIFTEEQLQAATEVYRKWMNLTTQEQQIVAQGVGYDTYRQMLEQMGEQNHFDYATGMDLRSNEASVLPWYVQVHVTPQLLTEEQKTAIMQVLGNDSMIFAINEIQLVSLLDGEGWIPEELLLVKMPMVDLGEYESAVIVHITETSEMEFLQGSVSDGCLEFKASGFSEYGIAGMMGTVDKLLTEKKTFPLIWWVAGGCLASALLLVLLLFRRKLVKWNE